MEQSAPAWQIVAKGHMGFISHGNTTTRKLVGSPRFNALLGSLIIGVWTMVRFFNHGPNFDQVGQQVLAHQWLHGLHSGSVIGPTNYVLKMIFLYMPLDFVNLPAQSKLIFMTLLVNILTFLLIIYVLQKIWREFCLRIGSSFYASTIYFSLIAGSVFWISFANSRNLEVAGGLYLIYLCIRAFNDPSRFYYGLIILFGSILFFADPLQIYMSLLPVIIFVCMRWATARDKQQLVTLIRILICSFAAILVSKLLLKLSANLWNVSFMSTPTTPHLSLTSLRLGAEQAARLYTGGYEGGRIRETIDLLIIPGVFIGALYTYLRKPKSRLLMSLVAAVVATDLAIYILSGQSLDNDTNRYLIMTVPMFILMMAATLYYLPKQKIIAWGVGGLLLFNVVTLAGAFAENWNPHFTNNNHERSAINYMERYHYGYASIGTALSSDFLSNEKTNLLPLGCEPDQTLKKTALFFDKAGFNISNQQSSDSLVPIVLDSNIIKINQAGCEPDQIRRQLGPETAIDRLSDGSTVMLYRASQLDKLPG